MKRFCHLLFLCLLWLPAAMPAHGSDALTIKAPAESASVNLTDSAFPAMMIEDWVCGTAGAAVQQRAVDLIYRLRLAEQAFKNATSGIQSAYENRKKAVKAPAAFKGLAAADAASAVAAAVSRFPRSLQTLNADLSRLYNDLAAPVKGEATAFFSVSLTARPLYENHLDDKLKLASWEDDGAYQVWTTIDCYSGAELKAMQSAVGLALAAAMAARDDYNRTALRLHDGQGEAYRFKP